jgi:ATP-binding cassette, subfamily B, bacterial
MRPPILASFRGVSVSTLLEAFRAFRPSLAGQGRGMAKALGLALAVTALELVRPWPTKLLFDNVLLPDADDRGLWGLQPAVAVPLLAASVAGIALLVGWLSMRSTVVTAEVSRKVTTRLRRRIFEHLHRLELPYHQATQSGDLLVRLMGDVNLLRDALFASWLALAERGALFVGMAVVLFLLDPTLAICALLPIPLLAFGLGRSSTRLRAATKKQRRREGDAAAYAVESLRQIHLVKAYAQEGDAARAFSEQVGAGERAGVKAARIAAQMARLTESMTGIGLALVILVGTRRVLDGALTPGGLLVATSYARTLYKPLRRISREGGRLAKASAGAERVLDVLRREPEPTDVGIRAERLDGDIVFFGVRYRYAGGQEALKGMTFDIEPGMLAVLAGPNGSGKSTTLALLLRLFARSGGFILLDGKAIERYELRSLRRCFAYVPQEIQLFSGTVRENILYGRPEATDAEVEAAARAALVHDVIRGLPDGYDTVLGEGGGGLSGGQARRLMLARAALRDASILILDEPLAGLDPESRLLVSAAVRSIANGRTTLVVSHGPSHELQPDLVLHLADGAVARIEKIAQVVDLTTAPRLASSDGPW